MKEELRENMKKQTIGVEVEMNSITREDAARVAAEYFGTGNYKYTASVDGYFTWSAFDAQGRKWKFSRDSSIYGPDEKKCEMITPILRYEDIHLLQGLVRVLREAGARSDWTRNCGVHVHIGADGHTPETLRNLMNVVASHEDLLIDAVGVAPDRLHWCQKANKHCLEEVNKAKPKTMSKLSDIWYESQGCTYGRDFHYNESRYHLLNLHATFTKGTVEFRLFQFDKKRDGQYNGIHAGQLKAFIQMCLAISNYAKVVNRAKPGKAVGEHDNPRYVMRFWMKSMGMIGDEFKTAREFFLSKLEGSSDCRCGDRRYCNHRVA